MTIDDRLTRAADEMRTAADVFDPPGIQQGWALRWRRRLVAAVAMAMAVACLTIAGIWGATEIATREIEPTDTESGPVLQWTAVPEPPPVDQVLDLWTTGDGYAVWSGDEVWTSPDGQVWDLATTTPTGEFSADAIHPLQQVDGVWLAVGQAPEVWRSDGAGWAAIPLPVDVEAGNDLLAVTVRPTHISSSEGGIVVAGIVIVSPDPEAVLTRFAPDVDGGQVVFDDTVVVEDADGEVVMSIPYEEIDTRFADGMPLMSGAIWHSVDGTTWQQVASPNRLPLFLGADDTGFVVVTGGPGLPNEIWTSSDGVVWVSATITPVEPTSGNLALRNGVVIAPRRDSLSAIDRNGHRQTISGGDAFTDLDPNWTIGMVQAGPYGIVAIAYDSSIESVPVTAIWYSPDGRHWSRQDLQDLFREQGTVLAAVGDDDILIGHDPGGEAFGALRDRFTMWIATR